MMPVVARSWTHADHERFSALWMAGKSKAELAHEGMWLTDNCTPDVRAFVFAKVPAPLAFVLRHTFGRRYDRLKRALWGGTPAYDLPPLTVTALPA